MKLYLSNQEVVLALHQYLTTQRNCERNLEEKPNFQVTTDNRGLLMIEVDGYNQKTKNLVQSPTEDVVQLENVLSPEENQQE